MRKANESAVSAEINQFAQALADFKSKYGDYPPSRVYLSEYGNYSGIATTTMVTSLSTSDISVGQLIQRSLVTLRKFFPRAVFSTTGNSGLWYDFNGNGIQDQNPYILDGRQCLVFFLGGVPQYNSASGTFQQGMTGFGRLPTNPFSNSIPGNGAYSNNRVPPLFEFKGNRLKLIPTADGNNFFPAYFDSNSSTSNPSYFAYFSAYGGSGYDPNDVNVAETDNSGTAISLSFQVTFPLYNSSTAVNTTVSPPPNPYTTSLTTTSVSYQSPQTFQIISPGADNDYGLGGQYISNSDNPLPLPATGATYSDSSVRTVENDNVTNFHNGRLN